jgi:hypothetical protein
MIEVAGGVMGVATAGTDYTSPSSTETFTNKTYDTAGTGNSLSINGVAATANTGTGAVVRDTSPTLVTPILGVAAATTVNKVALTAPATGSTLTIADGQTLTVNGSATITNGTHSGTNTGDEVVAIGSELDTGTDDVKYASALALKNSHNVPSVAPGTSGNLLQSNGTDWISATVAGGGQTTFTAIVAASGGDYTTVSAAIAAASAGWTIRVMPGTYTEAGWTSALTNISIVGENWAGTVLNFTTNSVTHSGANFTVKGVQMNFTTGVLTTNGADDIFENMYFGKTGANAGWAASGANLRVNNSKIISTYNTPAAGLKTVNFSGTNPDITNNYIETKNVNSTTSGNDSAVSISGSAIGANIVGNYINGTSTSGAGNLFNAGYGNIIANWIVLAAGATGKAFILDNPGGVANNSIKTTDGTAIYIYCNNFMATGNYLESKNGILVDVGVTYGTFSTNQFRTSTASGTFISINASGANNIAVVGNQFEGTSTTVGVLIHATAKYTTIVGNNFLKSMTTPITDNSKLTTIKNNTGTDITLNKEFVYCKNTSGATIAVGDIVTWKAVAAGNEITTTTTASDNLVFGVSEESIANNASGYIQVSGKTVDLKVNGTTDIAVGDFITTYTTAGIGAKATAGMLGTTPGDLAIAIALEAYTTDNSSGVIDALIIEPRRL